MHSRFPVLESSTDEIKPNEEVEPTAGCNHCDTKKCDICNKFLKQNKTEYKFYANSIFKINYNVNCESKNIVYIINDLVCKVSSVGYTSENIKVNFRKHKNHI